MWKTPDQKPERTGNIVYVLEDGDFGNFFYIEGKDFPTVVMANQFCFITEDKPIKMVKWTYLTDLIAQADKAERLQKAVDYVYKLLLEEANFTAGAHLPNKYQQKIFEVIKQLIKRTTNDK